ncbi:hypothetical protein, partial [Pseudomonas salomonii]|uniref:hypothetical protein n=1 Tax=Pseudomonas salomonii TaxID=191391 RepID=UPI001F3B8226
VEVSAARSIRTKGMGNSSAGQWPVLESGHRHYASPNDKIHQAHIHLFNNAQIAYFQCSRQIHNQR